MSYVEEYQSALRRIDAENRGVRTLGYFMRVASLWHASVGCDPHDVAEADRRVPVVVVLGYGIAEQLVHACGVAPLHLLGGSHASCAWSDELMPRDCDCASRSIMGYALRLAARADLDPLFVVPVATDSLRKIAYLLRREGQRVLCVDVPPVDTSTVAQQAWESANIDMLRSIERHVGVRVTSARLAHADELVGLARAAMLAFERTCVQCEGILSDEARLLVLHTYHQAGDLAQWTQVLRELTRELRERHHVLGRSSSGKPRVLLFGSPIVFPQYKVMGLMCDVGLTLHAIVDAASTARLSSLPCGQRRMGPSRLVRTIAHRHYVWDSSGAHVVNRAMEQYVEYLLAQGEVDGIICHILKSQIEYDFMLSRLEPLFERYGIPVFRLETDYQYQDVEQLRIRLEAFAEMLDQRTFALCQTSGYRRGA